MNLTVIDPPRVFEVGRGERIQLKHHANIKLEADELITFVSESGAEYDVTRKSWGFYATPSLNGRLRSFGLRAVLIKAPDGKFYIFLLEDGKEEEFQHYLSIEGHTILCWLDNDEALNTLEEKLKGREDAS